MTMTMMVGMTKQRVKILASRGVTEVTHLQNYRTTRIHLLGIPVKIETTTSKTTTTVMIAMPQTKKKIHHRTQMTRGKMT